MTPKKPGPTTARTSGSESAPEARRRRWLLPAVVGLVLAGGGVMAYFLFEERPVVVATTPRARSLAQRTFLPARGRTPRPHTLDPVGFQDSDTRRAYEIAREVPELLEQMPCYCGCYANSGHASNYDCFVDNHGAT